MPARTTCRLLGFLGVSLALAAAVGVGLQAADLTHVSRSTGPTGYRGLVAANFDASDTRDEIVGDFGSIGCGSTGPACGRSSRLRTRSGSSLSGGETCPTMS